MKLYYTTIKFIDELDYKYEADVVYFVDQCLDTKRFFVDEFELRDFSCLNEDGAYIAASNPAKFYYDDIMEAISNKPGARIEEV